MTKFNKFMENSKQTRKPKLGEKRLKARQKDYDDSGLKKELGYTRPGSLNSHKC